jgi:hypothetical protein
MVDVYQIDGIPSQNDAVMLIVTIVRVKHLSHGFECHMSLNSIRYVCS